MQIAATHYTKPTNRTKVNKNERFSCLSLFARLETLDHQFFCSSNSFSFFRSFFARPGMSVPVYYVFCRRHRSTSRSSVAKHSSLQNLFRDLFSLQSFDFRPLVWLTFGSRSLRLRSFASDVYRPNLRPFVYLSTGHFCLLRAAEPLFFTRGLFPLFLRCASFVRPPPLDLLLSARFPYCLSVSVGSARLSASVVRSLSLSRSSL